LCGVLWLLPWSPAARAGQGTGTIQGVVKAATVPAAATIKVTTDRQVCGDTLPDHTFAVDGSGGLANAVISVPGVPWPEAPQAPTLNNTRCLFVPRVQVAGVKSVVAITSEDNTLHTTHAYDDRNRDLFNIAMPVAGLTIKRPLPRPGLVRIECDSHGWMRAWMLVTPDVATTSGSDGRFTLAGIPAGTREVTVWHEKLTAKPQKVTVPAGGTVEVTFALQ